MTGSVPHRSHGFRLFDLPASTSAGRRALRLVAGGLAFAVACVLLNGALGAAGIDASIGPLHVIAALAFLGLLAVVAGGVMALIAITRHGERSAWIYATLPLSLFALLVAVAQAVFDVP